MTYVFVLLMCLFASVASAQKDSLRVPPNIVQSALNCMAETGVNPDVLPRLGNPAIYAKNDDKRLQKFINCTFNKLGYAKKNGRVRVEKVAELLPRDIDNETRLALKKVVGECNKETGADAAETTFKIFGCFIRTSPMKLSLA